MTPQVLSTHPPSPLPTVTTINFLPTEILANIFEFSVQESDWYINRRTLLLRLSLVCSRWTVQAQMLLWKVVVLEWEPSGKLLLESPALGRWRTPDLAIRWIHELSDGRIDVKTASKAMGELKGVEKLRLDCLRAPTAIDLSDFCSPNLSGLKKVTLDYPDLINPTPQLPLFHLTTLNIWQLGEDDDTVDNLSFFISPSLIHFSLIDSDFEDRPIPQHLVVGKFLLSIGPQLQSLTLLTEIIGPFIPAFSSFTNLLHLRVECLGREFTPAIRALRSHLKTLSVTPPYHYMDPDSMEPGQITPKQAMKETVKAVIESLDQVAFKDLEEFWFLDTEHEVVIGSKEGERLVCMLTDKGIQLKFGVDFDRM